MEKLFHHWQQSQFENSITNNKLSEQFKQQKKRRSFFSFHIQVHIWKVHTTYTHTYSIWAQFHHEIYVFRNWISGCSTLLMSSTYDFLFVFVFSFSFSFISYMVGVWWPLVVHTFSIYILITHQSDFIDCPEILICIQSTNTHTLEEQVHVIQWMHVLDCWW